MLVLLGVPLYLLGLVPGMQAKTDPRKFLFDQEDFSGFKYAIIGDSVFCSFYVDSIKDTIWERFEALTGIQCFPAALNGATIADMVDASDHLSTQLPEGSTVFVGLIPSRFIGKGIVRHKNYFNDFDQLKKMNEASHLKWVMLFTIDTVLDNFLLYREPYSLENYLRKKKGTYETGHKVWNIEGLEKSRYQYRSIVEFMNKLESHIDIVALAQIRDNLAGNNITTVFVLSPINQGMIKEFSGPEEADAFIAKFRDVRDELVEYFNDEGIKYLDLFDTVDTTCFSDMVHLNTCGDDVMARAFADYALHNNDRKK